MREHRGYTISFDGEYPPCEVYAPNGEWLGGFHTEKDAMIFIDTDIAYASVNQDDGEQ